MNKTLQTLEIKVENNGATPQGKIFAREWNVLVEAVKALDLKEFDEAKLLQFLRDNDFITSEDIPDIDFSNVVTLSGQQTIPGPKDFVGGIKVNGMPITYNAELGVWELTGDLFVTGNFAWGSSIDGFKPSTVTDAVRVDGSTIIKKKDSNGDWYLYAPGGGSGGLTLGDVNDLIAYALVGYATQSWVGDNYLSTSGGTITTDSLAGFSIYRNNGVYSTIHFYNTQDGNKIDVGYLGAASDGRPVYINAGGGVMDLIHSGNIGQQSVNRAASAGAADSVSVTPVTESGNYSLALFPSSSTRTQAVCVGNNHKALFNPSTGALTATSFVGNLTGNADTASKLATPRTIWGQSFDGTEKITHGFRSLYADNYNGGVAHNILNNQGSPYGLLTRIFGNGSVSLQAQREANDAECFNLLLNHLGGNVVIGGTETGSCKLRITTTRSDTFSWVLGDLASKSDFALEFNYYDVNRYGLYSAINYISGDVGLQVGRSDGETAAYNLVLNPLGGNVAIGGTTAEAKLHVHGNIITTGNIEGGIFGLRNSSPDNPWLRLTVGNQNYYVQATSDGIYLGPTSTLSLKVDANGNTTINGNLLVYGNVSWFSHSQRSLKNIVSEQGLSLAQLERIKPIKFYWKDGRDMVLHVGGVADVFAEVLPEVVTRNLQDILCLNYVDAAFYVGASLIAPVLDHERRITQGEEEQEALKKENAKLKRELEGVKSKLNQLVA